jgi:uncharacterized SAM-binding protein YcdF (DUF218 family)
VRKLLEKLLMVPNDRLPKKVDVIVGIGAGLSRAYTKLWSSIDLSLQSEKVLHSVINLFEKHKAKRVFFSGGYSYRGRYEAEIMFRKFLDSFGEDDIFYHGMETKSRNSLGNAIETLKWMLENDCKSAIIVDFTGHLKQMRRIFLKQSERTQMRLYFVNARAIYGGNSQTRLNNFYSFFIWEMLTNIYYKMKGVL